MDYNILIIGGGPAGYVAAIRAAQYKNQKICLVERENLGGTCLNWGCIPTKAMLHAADVFDTCRNAEKFGISNQNITFDIKKIIDFSRTKVVSKLQHGIDYLMKKNKITVIKDECNLLDKNTVNLIKSKKKITAENIILATGSSPINLPNVKVDGEKIWNYRHAMTPQKLPKSLLIIGSGAIGIEFASFYNRLGVEVHVLEIADRILINEDVEISKMAMQILSKQGIKFYVNSSVQNIAHHHENLVINIKHNKKNLDLNIENIILAAGVKPNIENLNLSSLNIKHDKYITVNDFYQTNIDNIFAIGDIIGNPCLAHKASFDAVNCIDYICNKKNYQKKKKLIPACTYCTPQIASIGLTEDQARQKYSDIKIGRSNFSSNGRAIAGDHTLGMVKNIFDKKTGELLGAHIIGHEATELIHSYVVGMNLEITDLDYRHMIFAHPTLSEIIHEAVLDADDEAIH